MKKFCSRSSDSSQYAISLLCGRDTAPGTTGRGRSGAGVAGRITGISCADRLACKPGSKRPQLRAGYCFTPRYDSCIDGSLRSPRALPDFTISPCSST